MSKRVTLVLLLLMTVVLSGCSGAESDWVGLFIDTWLTTNGLANFIGEEADVGKIIDYVFDEAVGAIAPSPEDTAIDAAEATIRDIEKADDLLESAFATNDMNKIKQAQQLRPDDFTYHEAEAAQWMVEGNGAAASSATTASDLLVIDFVEQGGDCRSARLNQLQTRRNILVQQLDDALVKKNLNVQSNINEEIGRVDDEIQKILAGDPNLFCTQIGADKQ